MKNLFFFIQLVCIFQAAINRKTLTCVTEIRHFVGSISVFLSGRGVSISAFLRLGLVSHIHHFSGHLSLSTSIRPLLVTKYCLNTSRTDGGCQIVNK